MPARLGGFTMVETLAVALVLTALAAMLVSAQAYPRTVSRRSMCGNCLGNIIKCCHLYADAKPNLAQFPTCSTGKKVSGHKAMAKLYNAYVKDHRVYSCPSKSTDTSVLKPYVAPHEKTLQTGYSKYGYDPGHTPVHATAGVVGDRGVLHATNHSNSTNHGADGPGENVAIGAGSVEWWDAADARATKDANGRATTDDIYSDDLDPEKFPEELETCIIQ
jgi:hypothetical protein